MSKKQFNEKKFESDIKNYEDIMVSSRYSACQMINLFMVIGFYQIGRDLNKKGTLKMEYIKRMPQRLKKYRMIMSEDNLLTICKFSSLISFEEIASLGLQNIPWQDTKILVDEAVNHDDFVIKVREELEKGEA